MGGRDEAGRELVRRELSYGAASWHSRDSPFEKQYQKL